MRRALALSACFAAALTLNVLALGAFVDIVSRWQAPVAGASQVSRITVVAIAARPKAEEVKPPTIERGPAPPPESAEARPAPAARPPAPAAASVTLPPREESGSPVRFYRSSEVDRPAVPESDWNLDTATLDAAGVERLVFDIFIDREGAVVGSAIVEPPDLDRDTRRTLELRLRETIATPALRQGDAVASVRRIEVSVWPALR